MAYLVKNVEVCLPDEYRFYQDCRYTVEQIEADLAERRELEELLGSRENIEADESYFMYLALKNAREGNPAIKVRTDVHSIYPANWKNYHTVRFKFAAFHSTSGPQVLAETIDADNLVRPCHPIFVARDGKKRGAELAGGFLIKCSEIR